MPRYILVVVLGRLCRECYGIFRKRGPATRCDECQKRFRREYKRRWLQNYVKKNRIKMRYLWRVAQAKRRKSKHIRALSIVRDEAGNLRIKAALELERYRKRFRRQLQNIDPVFEGCFC